MFNLAKKIFLGFLVFHLSCAVVLAKTPNDPYNDFWFYHDLGVYRAWDISTGSKKVVVAIIDNGFDINHPDLKNNLWINIDEIPDNNIDDDQNGYVDDVYGWNFIAEDINNDGQIDKQEEKGNNNLLPNVENISQEALEQGIEHHATLIAGLIGAQGNNHQDMAGINWQVKLMNLKVMNANGYGDLTDVSQAIYYAVDNDADIINISIVGTGLDEQIISAVKYAYQHGVAVFAAAGNSLQDLNRKPQYPICVDKNWSRQKLIGVSAIDKTHHLAGFSNYGLGCIDITAPGTEIRSLLYYQPSKNLKQTFSQNVLWSGTSFATPFVSGAAALIKSVRPEWQAKDLYRVLLTTVHRSGDKEDKDYDTLFGSGLLQIDKAMEFARKYWPIVYFVDKNQGKVKELNLGKKLFSVEYSLPVLKNTQQILVNSDYYILLKGDNLFIYNQRWQKLKQIDLKTNNWSLKNLSSDKILLFNYLQQEIKILNLTNYSFESYSLKKIDNNYQVAVLNEQILLFNKQNLYKLDWTTKTMFKISDWFLKGNFKTVYSYDVDNDTKEELIILSQYGAFTYLNIYQDNLKLVNRQALGRYSAEKVLLTFKDYDLDQLADIIVYNSDKKIMIYTFTGQYLGSFQLLADFKNISLINSKI